MKAAALLTAAAMALAAPQATASERAGISSHLEPYRLLARSPQGERLLFIAREAMKSYWSSEAPTDSSEIDWPAPPVAIYVSLVGDGGTRACVGSGLPYRGGLVETVRALARRALHSDTRHPPIRPEELPRLRVVIAFAGAAEPIEDPMGVDPGRDGLLISSDGKSVAFLPGEARTVAWALREARRIGVLRGDGGSVSFGRFSIIDLAESDSGRLPLTRRPDATP